MATTIIDAIETDHGEIRALMHKVATVSPEKRAEAFHELEFELVRHEVAEQEILRPESKSLVGEQIAGARINEETKAEEALKALEGMDPASDEFVAKFTKLRMDVEKHAQAEETVEFPKLLEKEDPEKLRKMKGRFDAAKKLAPTHPHPSAPTSPAGRMVVGPLAAIADRVRDAVRDTGD